MISKEILLVGNIITDQTLVITGNIKFGGDFDIDVYNGKYEVTPKAFYKQILETANKLMKKNVTVHEVPYTETSNTYGTTVNIATTN